MKTFIRIIIPLVLGCLAGAPQAGAVCQEGCLTNGNTALGEDALLNDDTGTNNTAIGFDALYFNTTGDDNTATGYFALYNNTTGNFNTAIGYNALYTNVSASFNTAIGYAALQSTTIGPQNTAIGAFALWSNTIGGGNTATGEAALEFNTTGAQNTATGAGALALNTTGISNTGLGFAALANNKTGNYNTATGQGALNSNSGGSNNTAVGQNALLRNTTGKSNIAIGSNAGLNLTTGNNNIDIFDRGVAGESNTIRIGKQGTQTNTYVAGISGVTVPSGVNVIIDTSGRLGTLTSSARYKKNIHPMNDASEKILSLQPVTFEYKEELDTEGISQFGLVAEDVAKVDSDLVAKDEQGKPYTVRYEAVNAMLLNEFLKEHKKVAEQASKIEQLEKQLQQMAARLDAKGL